MDPRTFLPPRRLVTVPPPRPGERAPALPLSLEAGRPAIVAFLRHAGCPFAEATLRRLRDVAARLPQVDFIAVSHAGEEATTRWGQAVGGTGRVRLCSDATRRAYADWGLGRTSLGHFLGRRSLTAVAVLAHDGIRNRHPVGTRWQSAGTFAVDGAGLVRWRHLPAHAGDLPDLDDAVRALAASDAPGGDPSGSPPDALR